jgi:hypothetical protein
MTPASNLTRQNQLAEGRRMYRDGYTYDQAHALWGVQYQGWLDEQRRHQKQIAKAERQQRKATQINIPSTTPRPPRGPNSPNPGKTSSFSFEKVAVVATATIMLTGLFAVATSEAPVMGKVERFIDDVVPGGPIFVEGTTCWLDKWEMVPDIKESLQDTMSVPATLDRMESIHIPIRSAGCYHDEVMEARNSVFAYLRANGQIIVDNLERQQSANSSPSLGD